MKKYKNKLTGDIVEHYLGYAYRDEEGYILPFKYIKDSSDWEEVKQALYTTYDGVDRFEYQKEHWVVNDEYAYYLEIVEGHLGMLSPKSTYKIFSTKEAADEYVKSVRKPLFLSADGVKIYKGDSYVRVNNYSDFCLVTGFVAEGAQDSYNGLKFSTEEAAKDYILRNKPCLSLQNLLDVWGREDGEFYVNAPLFKNFEEVAKTKLK